MNGIKAQRGSALIVSLIILIVMTLLGLTAMGGSGLQEKMAGNNRDLTLAFQAAEAALRDGESYYENTVVSLGAAFSGANPGLYAEGSNPDIYTDATWANARSYSGSVDGVSQQPRYIIELIGEIGEQSDDLNIQGYGESSGIGSMTGVRVTARGIGGTDNAVVYLQSNYANRN
ncbi:MAG: PilX N-terminal domain-containing pilus assembly protein [Gammaproteobacteria bacterium]|jgi:type IV pilus assembly protein PilX|nr:PilX N-terminal domain-containing pilus assembly protein [Gammaproteobacteria bacterium]